MALNRRTDKRHLTIGVISTIWDGEHSCIGIIDDISSAGLLVSQIPAHFDKHSQECLSIVHGPYQDLKVALKPCWRSITKKEMYQQIGFQVIKPTKNWQRFVTENLQTVEYEKGPTVED